MLPMEQEVMWQSAHQLHHLYKWQACKNLVLDIELILQILMYQQNRKVQKRATHVLLDMTVMETETVLKVKLVIFVQMDISKKLMENVYFHRLFAVLDMLVMETETAFHIQWQQFVQVDLKVMETVIA